MGISARQARCMSWSNRKRGRLQRVHMKTKMMTIVFKKMITERRMQTNRLSVIEGFLGSTCPSKPGKCQPPKKSATQTADVVIIPAYSARKKRAKRMALYSV